MKITLKNFLKSLEKTILHGLPKDSLKSGCENTTESTEITSFSNPIYTKTTNMVKTYQWTKGEKMGNVVKTIGEKFIEDNIEYLVFNDGSMINTSLMNEYLIEIPSESEAMMMQDLAPTPLQRVEKKKHAPEPAPQAHYVQQVKLSPLENLLLDSKKTKETFTIDLEIELPSIELMKVLADSYDSGEDQILKFLASSIKFEYIKEKIAGQIAQKVFNRKPKTTKKKNERLQSTVQREEL